MSDHLDLDALADALAAESDPGSSGPPLHLAHCPTCTSRLAELRGAESSVRSSLAQLPDPSMPAGLVERITAALAAQAPLTGPGALRDAPVPTAPPASSEGATVTPLRPPRRWAPAVAAAVMVVAVGGLGYAVVSNNGSNTADSASTAGSSSGDDTGDTAAALPPIPTSDSGTDYAQKARVEAALPGVLAGGLLRDLSQSETFSTSGSALQPAASAAPMAGLPAVAGASPGARSSESAPTLPFSGGGGGADTKNAANPLAALRDPAALEACLTAVLPPEQPDARPLALDYATYQAKPALAVWLTDPDPTKVSVFVVGPMCSAADAALLFFTRVDRP